MLLDEVGRVHVWNAVTNREVKKAKIFKAGQSVGVAAPEGFQTRMLCVLPTHAEMWTASHAQKYNNLEGHTDEILCVVSVEHGPPRADGKPGAIA